jgi:hypothetical protein
MPPIESEIVRADAQYRRVLFTSYLVAVVVLLVIGKFVFPSCLRAFNHLSAAAYFAVAESAVILFLMLFIIPAAFLIRIGRKIVRFEKFPYPGMKVMRDTKVVTGRGALMRGRALIRLGYVSIGFAVAGSVAMHIILHVIRSSPILGSMPLF